MQIKKSTLQTIGLLLVSIVVIGAFFVLLSNKPAGTTEAQANTDTVTISKGVQFIDMTAKGGYSPKLIQAKANTPTTLRVTTNNTFDCSASLSIPSKSIHRSLPASGATEIDLGTQTAGAEINGTCAMGMYNFKIKFI